MRCRFIASFFFFAFSLLCNAASAQHYTFQSYGQRDGLRNLIGRRMVQDQHGFLWVGTEDGLFRFDGSSFQKMPMEIKAGTYITGLAQDTAGRVWASTLHSLYYFDDAGPHRVDTSGDEFEFDLHAGMASDPENPKRMYFVSHHQLFVAQRSGQGEWQVLPYFDRTYMATHPELKEISFVYARRDQQLWLGCGKGVCFISPNAFHFYGKKDGLPEQEWQVLFEDHLQRIWARGEHGLFRLDPHEQQFVQAGNGLPPFSIGVRNPTIIEDYNGKVLINLTEGIARFEGSSWKVFKEKIDLPSYAVDTLFSDRQGSLWLGIEGHGISRWLGYDEVESWTTVNGLSSNVAWGFLRNVQGQLWIATESNLEKMSSDNSRIEQQLDSQRNPMRRIQTLALTGDGHIWSGSDGGNVIDYDPETKATRIAAKEDGVFQIFPDNLGRMWICSLRGLFYVSLTDKNTIPRQIVFPWGGGGRIYGGVQDHDSTLWFVTDFGLVRLSGSTWSKIKLSADYSPALDGQITVAQDGTLWMSGIAPILMHLKIYGDVAEVLERVSSASLGSDIAYFLKIDRRGWLWVGTDAGLSVFNGQRWIRFTVDDGLIWNDLNSNAFYEDTDGSIWIGTSGGVSHLLHPERVFQVEPPTLWIANARIGNTVLNLDKETEVPWGNHPLTAELTSQDFKHESSINFRYRIEGLGEDWQDTPRHDLRYPPLPPGQYRLVATAFSVYDGRQSNPVSISFTVLPPWWRTRTAFAVEAAATILLVFLLWRWNVRILVARQRRLEHLVQDRTSELTREKAELLKARAALEELATHDSLTGLLNRGTIMSRLEMEMERAGREYAPLAIVLLDIDHFKRVNDTYGHVTGDCVLQEYAKRLSSAARPYDVTGRYGGEELVMILPNFPKDGAETRLLAMHASLCVELFHCNGRELEVTCSLGVAWYQPGLDTMHGLIERADRGLYGAKNAGRNRIELG